MKLNDRGSAFFDEWRYSGFCKLAAENEEVFTTFKKNPLYVSILEHCSREQGQQFYDKLTDPKILDKLPDFAQNDVLGSPTTYNYTFGVYSPTTLRYARVLQDLITRFDLSKKSIVEIGGGYGGQAYITSMFVDFDKYTIIDLPEAAQLTKVYLEKTKCGDNIIPISSEDSDHLAQESYDLVISNHAFSEVGKPKQDEYINTILKNSEHGYITYNHISGYPIEELISILTDLGKSVIVEDEDPQTSTNNKVITW